MVEGFGIFLILIMVFLAFRDYSSSKSAIHEDYKGSIISLGIFGTFFGILAGLWEFNTGDIEGSVPHLLDGLKTAFITSFVGMGLATLLQILQKRGESATEKESTDRFLEALSSLESSQKSGNRAIEEGFQKIDNTLQSNFAKIGFELRELKKLTDITESSRDILLSIRAVEKEIQSLQLNLSSIGSIGSEVRSGVQQPIDSLSANFEKHLQKLSLLHSIDSKLQPISENSEKIRKSSQQSAITLQEKLSTANKWSEKLDSINGLSETIQKEISEESACKRLQEWSREFRLNLPKSCSEMFKIEGIITNSEGGEEFWKSDNPDVDTRHYHFSNTREKVITYIPKEIRFLKGLKEFDLCCNDIVDIPDEVGSLTELHYLYLGQNRVKQIPDSLNNLLKIEKSWSGDEWIVRDSSEKPADFIRRVLER